MTRKELLERIQIDPNICGGQPRITGTRVDINIILDSLADGLSYDEVIDHYPQLRREDIRAAIAYASELARERVFKLAI